MQKEFRILIVFVFILCIMGYSLQQEEYLKFLASRNTRSTNYDMYVLTLQWGNTLCRHSNSCLDKLKAAPKNSLTIHGLWPSRQNGEWIQDCNLGHNIRILDDSSPLFTEMRKFWLSLTERDDESFWSHEYNTHGYCYSQQIKNYDYKNYFLSAMELYKRYSLPHILTKAFGDQAGEREFDYNYFFSHLRMSIPELRLELHCSFINGMQYLMEIRLLFDLNFSPVNTNFKSNCREDKKLYVIFQ